MRHRRDDVHAETPSNLAKRLVEFFVANMYFPTIAADASVAFSHTPAGAPGSALRCVASVQARPHQRGVVDVPRGAWLGWDLIGRGDPQQDRGAGQNDMRLARRGSQWTCLWP